MEIGIEQVKAMSKEGGHLLLLFILVAALLFAYSMFTRCSNVPIPGWCEVYWGAMRISDGGNPKVLIVYGDSGLGDHKLLEEIIEDPSHVGKRVSSKYLGEVSLGNLQKYDLVIVEEAKTMSVDKIKMFIDYSNTPGKKLVWTGDAGTETENNGELVNWDEYPESDKNIHSPISPWIRKKGEDIISLEKLFGVRYVANYCTIKGCDGKIAPWIGTFSTEDRKHPLVSGIRADLKMYGDFAVTTVSEEGLVTRILDVDFGSNLMTKDNVSLGRMIPVIASTGFGGNAVYYSIPPEMLAAENMPKDDRGVVRKYYSLVEKLYYGMLY